MKKLILILAVVVAMTSCSTNDEPQFGNSEGRVEFAPISLSRSEQEIVGKQAAFAFDFYKNVADYCNNVKMDNFMASPLSLSMALSMLANGAEGETRDEILAALGFEGEELDAVNTFSARLIREFALADAKTNLAISNSIWLDYRLQVKDGFINGNKAAYGAEIFTRSLGTEETKNEINAWASEKTHGVIPNFLESPLTSHALMVLLNALYFKSEWQEPFTKENTKRDVFYNADGTRGSADMMKSFGRDYCVKYDTVKKASWCKLYYGNKAYSLVFFLPGETTVEKYLESLSEDEFLDYVTADNWVTKTGTVQFPIFKAETNIILTEICIRLGIKKAFDALAEFSPISDTPLAVSSVKQKTYIAFDEQGTEAAAVTGILIDGIIAPEMSNMIVDRPFGYMIIEESTKSILFMGRVNRLEKTY